MVTVGTVFGTTAIGSILHDSIHFIASPTTRHDIHLVIQIVEIVDFTFACNISSLLSLSNHSNYISINQG